MTVTVQPTEPDRYRIRFCNAIQSIETGEEWDNLEPMEPPLFVDIHIDQYHLEMIRTQIATI